MLHRRTLLDRPKIVHRMRVVPINQHWLLLRLVTSAGMYVKEFVHGDLGRTTPNVGTLLGNEGGADILQLDVINVLKPGEPEFGKPLDSLHAADRPVGKEWRLESGTTFVKDGVLQ